MLVDDFLAYLLPDVQQCPPLIASRALLFAAADMCDYTRVWNDIIATPITLQDNVYVYTVPVPDNAQVCAVRAVYGPCGELTAKTMPQISMLLGNWQAVRSAQPLYFNGTPDNSQVRFFPIPLNANGLQLTLSAAFKPTLASTDLPDVLISQAHEALLSGAKARLFLEPGKAWSNAPLGKYHQDLFQAAKVDLRLEELHENVGSSINAVAPPFGFY